MQLTDFHTRNFFFRNSSHQFIESSDFIPTSKVSVLPILEEFDTPINLIECIAEGFDIRKAAGPKGIPPIVFKKVSKH